MVYPKGKTRNSSFVGIYLYENHHNNNRVYAFSEMFLQFTKNERLYPRPKNKTYEKLFGSPYKSEGKVVNPPSEHNFCEKKSIRSR